MNSKNEQKSFIFVYHVCYRNFTHLMYPTKWSSKQFYTKNEAVIFAKQRRSENKKDGKKPYPYIIRLIGIPPVKESSCQFEYIPEGMNPDDPKNREVYVKY